jgi:hypothetical protein
VTVLRTIDLKGYAKSFIDFAKSLRVTHAIEVFKLILAHIDLIVLLSVAVIVFITFNKYDALRQENMAIMTSQNHLQVTLDTKLDTLDEINSSVLDVKRSLREHGLN